MDKGRGEKDIEGKVTHTTYTRNASKLCANGRVTLPVVMRAFLFQIMSYVCKMEKQYIYHTVEQKDIDNNPDAGLVLGETIVLSLDGFYRCQDTANVLS